MSSTQAIRFPERNGEAEAILAYSGDKKFMILGTTVPTDGATGYALGAIFMKVSDGGPGDTLFINESETEDSADFNVR